ncbi:hypothetical protein SH16_01142 [Aeromonas caviae]|uniref:hypothetical protein n=1 Tax=Aeromonas caviae TaxID=648 RepID=UPI00065A15B8|nr:hypothetical protein [Aeromonas caviae]KLV47415.1 hypothetical protein SH16_01142 [Aeromonas caviae]
MLLEISLAVFAMTSALLGVLTLTSSSKAELWWKRNERLAKGLALNSFIVFSLTVVKVCFDKIDSDEKSIEMSKLVQDLDTSLSKQKELKAQLVSTEIKLQQTIESANKKELQYHKRKDLQLFNNWSSAFKAEREVNLRLLYFLAVELDDGNQLAFLYRPSYLRLNYLGNLIKAPNTDDRLQLKEMILLFDELNEINDKIRAGSSGVQTGNYDKAMAGFSRFYDIENNAKNAIILYDSIAAKL